MDIEYRKAEITDAELLIKIYDSAFYDDYVRYGACPAYGKSKETMEQSIIDFSKFVILCDGRPVGCLACQEIGQGEYEVGCLCVIPEFQGKGIGTNAMNFAKSYFKDWKKFTLVTPTDKTQNVKFYTEKCGFEITSYEADGNVKLARFVMIRN